MCRSGLTSLLVVLLHLAAVHLTNTQVRGCGLGQFNNSDFDCEACPSGKYQDQPGSATACASCAVGEKFVDAQTACSACDAGKYALAGNAQTTCKS